MAYNDQVLPMVRNKYFIRPEPSPGFLIKINFKRIIGLYPELNYHGKKFNGQMKTSNYQ
jgi:hypothetical protein